MDGISLGSVEHGAAAGWTADELTLSACSTRLSAGRERPVVQPIIEPPRVQGRPFAGSDWLLRPLPSEPPQWNFGENPSSSLANLAHWRWAL